MDIEIKDLHDLLLDSLFPAIDVKLRVGWHCDEEDIQEFDFIKINQDQIEVFYELYGYELLYATEGYFYLRPVSKDIKVYSLGMESMVVSQFLALMKMDPKYLETSGFFDLAELLEKIELMLGSNEVNRIFLKRRKEREMVGEQDIQNFQLAVKRSLRELSNMGFVSINPDFSKIYPRRPIFRFMDPVRDLDNPEQALKSIVKGEDPFAENDETEERDE